jgi:hypothetical protein
MHSAMERSERLRRWAALLDGQDGVALAPLIGIEPRHRWARHRMQRDGSPLSIAFADPALRRHGLRGNTVGEAARAWLELK